MTGACIGEPISWLRLERHALAPDPAVEAHVAACAACRRCLDEIRGDAVALPPLIVPVRRARGPRWWRLAVPALAAAAAAVVLAVVVTRPPPRRGEQLAGIKGLGDVTVRLVRERAGAIRLDATTFAAGDRWKVELTCTAAAGAWIDVAVTEAGAQKADHPIAPSHVACGNAVAVPGAFELTGDRPNEICVRVGAARDDDGGRACVTVAPEKR